ncbi:probable cytochrome P450 12d1 proximal, mitochondrial [Drosophila guanche]|uniref:Blast:Probable cytochrome P450 12d1 proximal, mitochondrial n=1 Tax=Drosophila guanche TaxID=7266 RepID=A0A3B0IZT2_DROGU|nr:probable cytochrome P450 12d1 proximal, mitochondrial [Drosophila guanche]SPP73984.1 blast:Probable cytochrome P450 12d1 proximal%2C mitochondrial [Drosophila guanche]
MNAWQSLTRRVAVATGPLRSVRSASAQAQVKVEDVEVRPFSEVPRPGKLQFMRSFMPGGEFSEASVFDFSMVMRQRYGDIFVQPGMFGRKDTVVTYSTSDIATVFRNEGAWPRRETFDSIVYFREHIRPDVYGYSLGLATAQAEDWGKIRSAVNPIFMQPKGLQMYFEPLSNINNEFIERIKEIRDPRTLEVPANFVDELQRLIFESLNLIAFDRQTGIIRRNRDNPDALTLFRTSRDILSYSFKLDMQPSMWKLVSTPTYRKMMRTLNESLDVAQRFLAESQQVLEERRKAGEQVSGSSMLQRLLAIDPKLALIIGLDILFAGVDATATLLSAVLLTLALHPAKQQKLREELLKIMPTKESLLSEDTMKDMPYLRAVIKETLRYYPNGLGTMRTCPDNVTLSGYNVPKGTPVLLAANAMMKDPAYYPQPEEFLPERWLRDPQSGKRQQVSPPFTFLPFGFGPRQCIGKRVVDLEVETSVAKLIRNFQVEFLHDASKPYKTLFVMQPAIDFRFKFTDLPE